MPKLRYKDSRNYIRIFKPDHPFANHRGYVMEHRLIYEYYLKILFDENIYIPKNIEIDHDNEDKTDNSLINLNCFTHLEHRKKHKKDLSNRICLLCKDNKTNKNKKGINLWYKYQNSIICQSCYGKINYNPILKKQYYERRKTI